MYSIKTKQTKADKLEKYFALPDFLCKIPDTRTTTGVYPEVKQCQKNRQSSKTIWSPVKDICNNRLDNEQTKNKSWLRKEDFL